MASTLLLLSALLAAPLGPGDHARRLEVGGRQRSYVLHLPARYDGRRPMPLVLAFHGAGTNGPIMAYASGLSATADREGFIVVYPNGSGKDNLMLVWNAGGFHGPGADQLPDDVAFVRALLDDVASLARVNRKRVFATGMSNGGMMCYRLAVELSDRIAAIAPVSGTMAVEGRPTRRVPVMHFHGTEDTLVPFHGPEAPISQFLSFKSVDETIRAWVGFNGCSHEPITSEPRQKVDDGTKIRKQVYSPASAEVILWTIEGGGHTWPGRPWPIPWLGRTTGNLSANDEIWAFFQRHPLK